MVAACGETRVNRPSVEDYREFVRSRSASLVHLAFWMTGNWQDAEDIVQDALVKVYLAWPGAMHPDAYARRIVVNGSRRRFRLRRREVLVAEPPDGTDLPKDAEAVLARRALLTALASLPRQQRAVVVLRYCLDRPESEVAAAMGCSVGTIKSQASKALAKLRSNPALASPESAAPTPAGDGDAK